MDKLTESESWNERVYSYSVVLGRVFGGSEQKKEEIAAKKSEFVVSEQF